MLPRHVAAQEVAVGRGHATEGRVASRRHAGHIQVNGDVRKLVALHFVDRACEAEPDRKVDCAALVRIRPASHHQAVPGLGENTQHILAWMVALYSAKHAIDEIIVFAEVLRQVQLHALVDGHLAGERPPVFAELAVEVVVGVLLHVPGQHNERRLSAVQRRQSRVVDGGCAATGACDDLRLGMPAVQGLEVVRSRRSGLPRLVSLAEPAQSVRRRLAGSELIQNLLEACLLAAPGVQQLDPHRAAGTCRPETPGSELSRPRSRA